MVRIKPLRWDAVGDFWIFLTKTMSVWRTRKFAAVTMVKKRALRFSRGQRMGQDRREEEMGRQHRMDRNMVWRFSEGSGRQGKMERYMSRLMTKPTKWHLCPLKTQICLDIRPVRSESSLSAWRKLGSWDTSWAHSEDSDQTRRMSRLICLSWAHSHFVGFVMMQLTLCHNLTYSTLQWLQWCPDDIQG